MNILKPVSGVEILFVDQQWTVRVNDGGKIAEQQFALEANARSFAEGQRIRLERPIAAPA